MKAIAYGKTDFHYEIEETLFIQYQQRELDGFHLNLRLVIVDRSQSRFESTEDDTMILMFVA